jgi:long-chain fatty acid transport protein
MKKLFSALVLGGLASGSAWASGTHIDLQNARAEGLATAITANSVGPSSVYFNPAAIVQEGRALSIELGDTLILPNITYTSPSGNTQAVTNVVPPFTGYLTYGITKDLAFGFGVFSPFGLKVSWPNDFAGRFVVQQSQLETFYFNPELAYRFGIVKVGAGVQVVRGTVDLKRALNFLSAGEGSTELGGATWGVGGNAGIQAEVLPGMLTLAAAYRSRVTLNFDGNAQFNNVPVEFQGPQQGQIHDQPVKATTTLPDIVQLGLSFQPVPQFRFNFDADYFAWQLFHDLTVTFPNDPSLNTTNLKNWHHGWQYHFGGEYDVTNTFAVRAGVMIDPTPSPDETLGPDVPDSDRINLCAGVGYHANGFTADLGGEYIIFKDKPSTLPELPGTYGGHVGVIGLSLGYTMGL